MAQGVHSKTETIVMARNKNSRTQPTCKSDASLLSAYLGEVSKTKLLTPAQEKQLATEIVDRRIALWKALLSCPPFILPIVELLERVLDDDDKQAVRTELAHGRAGSHGHETKTKDDSHADAHDALALAMAKIDLDGRYADIIAADLEAIDAGRREAVALQVRRGPKDSQTFVQYLQRVSGAHQALRHAKNEFTEANLRLVLTIARRYGQGRMPLQDLVQEGNLGLMKAVDRFDVGRGFRFSTYATWWIRHAINRALANKSRMVRFPVHVFAHLKRLHRATREIEARTGESPTVKQLAEATKLSKARVRRLRKLTLDEVVSLDLSVGDGRGEAIDRLEDSKLLELSEGLDFDMLRDHLFDLLDDLDPIELDIIRRRYGLGDGELEPMTLRQVGERHALSRERVRQLQKRALGKLRREFARRKLLLDDPVMATT